MTQDGLAIWLEVDDEQRQFSHIATDCHATAAQCHDPRGCC
jgi:hypothetical protein